MLTLINISADVAVSIFKLNVWWDALDCEVDLMVLIGGVEE